MKRMLVFAFTMLAVLTLCQIVADDSQATVFSDSESNQSNESAQPGLTMERMNLMPLSFTENQGQWDERVKFRANAGGAMMWYTTDGVYYQFTRCIPVSQDDIALSVPSVAWPSWPWVHEQDARATVIPVVHEDIHPAYCMISPPPNKFLWAADVPVCPSYNCYRLDDISGWFD